MYHLKHEPTTTTYYGIKNAIRSRFTPASSLKTLESTSFWLLGCCSCQPAMPKKRADVNTVHSQPEHVFFILEHYFATKSSTAFHKVFSNIYLGKEVPNKTTIP
jgi:hypothetical protein